MSIFVLTSLFLNDIIIMLNYIIMFGVYPLGKKKIIWLVVLGVAISVFIACAIYFISDYMHYRSITDIGAYGNSTTSSEAKKPVDVPVNFEELKKVNDDIYAWISIAGEDPDKPLVDYPILQSKPEEDDNFYLNHNVNKKSSVYGAIYTQNYNKKDFSDFNTLIYGHDMRNGTMFGSLENKYRNKEYFENHREINIYMPGRVLKYKIFAAYRFDDRHILLNYNFSNKTERELYLETVYAHKNPYTNFSDDIKVTADDKIITLSTCTSRENERYLVQGVLVYDSDADN